MLSPVITASEALVAYEKDNAPVPVEVFVNDTDLLASMVVEFGVIDIVGCGSTVIIAGEDTTFADVES